MYASSSSVYGANTRLPFSVHDNVDHPLSLYAATKKANELMAHTYAHLYGLPCTGLRFFTVYGPWGRPDMALFLFTRAILEGRPIDVFNEGRMQRDFTYVDDVVEGVVRVLAKPPSAESGLVRRLVLTPATSRAPYRVYNIGNDSPVELLRYIDVLETCLGRKARRVSPADATWRRSGHSGGCRRPGPGLRLPAADHRGGRRGALRRVVSGVLSGPLRVWAPGAGLPGSSRQDN